ncbi:Alpha/Beta hydrolase protein [Lipomyces orientalis]|uniref:Alpha/Beta hydrolase protein n=1 Tax=Lipomyces orientalis TaxID=1233043 RepID=A0ACC3TCQ5_9ASCO
MQLPFGLQQLLEWSPPTFGLYSMLESFLRSVTSCLPLPIFALYEGVIRRIYAVIVPSATREQTITQQIVNAAGFVDMCALYGYSVEEHIVKTTDGYLLGVHRIYRSKCEITHEVPPQEIVYFQHGLLGNSENFVCVTDPKRCLPFLLVEQGYDVWLGNNRGNKYSRRHVSLQSTENAFWNFSVDEFALYDIPNTVDYILSMTGQKALAYVGFSQGSAQAFAALSIRPQLNDQVKVIVGLSPAMAPRKLRLGIIDELIKSSPSVLYFFLGRKAILSSTINWQRILHPSLFVRMVDTLLNFLFGWHGKEISFQQKVAAYSRLGGIASVKTIVHWFQIMRHSRFQMFDDGISSPLRRYGDAFYKSTQFPTRNIRSPICLIYGTSDSLLDIDSMLRELPSHVLAIPVKDYEHLDIIWGKEVHYLVIPRVLSVLDKYLYVPVNRLADLESHARSESCNEKSKTLGRFRHSCVK